MATKKLQTTDNLTFLISDREQGNLLTERQQEVQDFIRKSVTIAASAGEESFLPPELSTLEFLYVKANIGVTGAVISLRTSVGGNLYDIPDGGFFYLFGPTAGFTDVLITGGSDPAEVDIIIGGTS